MHDVHVHSLLRLTQHSFVEVELEPPFLRVERFHVPCVVDVEGLLCIFPFYEIRFPRAS